MNVQDFFARLFGRKSYSQRGEDLMIASILKDLGVREINYFDLGASNYKWLSNTYLFYKQGARGLLVDADFSNFEKLLNKRKGDEILYGAIVPKKEADTINFYEFSNHTRSCLDRGVLEDLNAINGGRIVKSYPVKTFTVTELFDRFGVPDLFCIDIEGGDKEVIKSIDFGRYRPKVLCVEILDMDLLKIKTIGVLDKELISFLKSKNYCYAGHTMNNGIFVDLYAWDKKIGIKRG